MRFSLFQEDQWYADFETNTGHIQGEGKHDYMAIADLGGKLQELEMYGEYIAYDEDYPYDGGCARIKVEPHCLIVSQSKDISDH